MKRLLMLSAIVLLIVALVFSVGCVGRTGGSVAEVTPGIQGDQGTPGIQGAKGAPGIQGPKGDKGDKGDKGAKGDRGPSGGGGFTGATGATGAKGDPGLKGDTGDPGSKGDKGNPGEQGLPGTFPYAMQMGVCDIPFSGAGPWSAPVSFDSGFTGSPLVFVTVTGPAKVASNFNVAATSVFTTGFTVKISYIGESNPSTGTFTVHWLAISP